MDNKPFLLQKKDKYKPRRHHKSFSGSIGLTNHSRGKKFKLKKSADFHAYVFAPNAKVKVEKGGGFFGALIAKEAEFKEGSDFHDDESLPLNQFFDESLSIE